MSDNNENSGKNLLKIVLVLIVIIVLIGSSFYVLTDGIISIIKKTAESATGDAVESVKEGIQWLGLAKVSNGLPTFVIDKTQVESLKSNLENNAVNTDATGLTEIRLRKILLAYAVSSSLSDTVCVVETSEEDIIEDFKEKNEEYKEDDSVKLNTVLNKYGNVKSSEKWNVTTPNYTLYYTNDTSTKFFYFKDTNKIFGDNENTWFLGAMGATTISTSDGANLNYVTSTGFDLIKENFDAVGFGEKLKSDAYKQMLSSYTREGDVIKLYTVDVSEKAYYFSFENKNIEKIEKIEEPTQSGEGTNIKYDIDADSVYNVGIQEINLDGSIDLSKYAIPIELMVDLLNITGSGEFVETFIDYALKQIDTSVTAYTLKTEQVAYNQKKYNISSDFVIEMYDIIDWGIGETIELDDGEDNFKAYYDIIYNRKYNGVNLPNNKVTSIADYELIDYNEIEYDTNKKYSVEALHKYLKTAYDPSYGFDLGDIEVTEVITTTTNQNNWRLIVSKIGTWYGDFTYTIPNPEVIYSVPEKIENANEDEYNSYNHTKMTKLANESDIEQENRYIYNRLVNQVNNNAIDISKCEIQYSNDIYDNVMKVENGADNRPHFDNWVIRGLATIAKNDSGNKNIASIGGTGIDYIYCKYKKTNVKKYEEVYKNKTETINENNIVQTTSSDDLDKKLKNFLELLRNKTGKIPTAIGSEGGFTAKKDNPSIVVKYADIYEGVTPVGDLLLDNGALMLFELLESSENTQSLVVVFKYLAYLYTETDYGVTNLQDLPYVFNLNSRTALYGNSVEEKIWFALRNEGFSEIAVAGVMGNIYGESGFNPEAIESTGEGYGLCQWSYDRKKQLIEYANSKGVEWTDVDIQIDFLITEIKGTGPATGYASAQMNYSNEGYTKSNWENATTVKESTIAFCYVFERPGNPRLERRITMAQQYNETYKGKEVPSKGNYTGAVGEKLCQAAKTILDHTTKYSYTYNVSVPDYSEGVRALWNKRGVCCASYVAWILAESGVVSEDYINSLSFRSATALGEGLKKIFPTVTAKNMNQLQKGDIVVWPGHHVQMYAGNGYWYNGGAEGYTPPIRYSNYDALSWFSDWGYYYVLRPVQQ